MNSTANRDPAVKELTVLKRGREKIRKTHIQYQEECKKTLFKSTKSTAERREQSHQQMPGNTLRKRTGLPGMRLEGQDVTRARWKKTGSFIHFSLLYWKR